MLSLYVHRLLNPVCKLLFQAVIQNFSIQPASEMQKKLMGNIYGLSAIISSNNNLANSLLILIILKRFDNHFPSLCGNEHLILLRMENVLLLYDGFGCLVGMFLV